MEDRRLWMERELDTVPPNVEEERHPTPTSSPPTPPSPLPVSVGPGYQQYFFPSSPSNSPPFSPTSSSPAKPQTYEAIPQPQRSNIASDKKPSKSYTPATEYSPLLPHFATPPDEAEDEDYVEWSTNRRTPRSFLRRWLQRIFCCCGIPDCCPPLFTD